MKPRFLHSLFVVAVAATFVWSNSADASVMAGDRLLIDIGRTGTESGSAGVAAVDGNYWNNYAAPAATTWAPGSSFAMVGDLVRASDGSATGAALRYSGYTGSAGNVGIGGADNTNADATNAYPESATRDTMFFYAPSGGSIIDIVGLDPALTYDLTFFGSVPSSQNRPDTTIKIGSESHAYDPAVAAQNGETGTVTADFAGVSPEAYLTDGDATDYRIRVILLGGSTGSAAGHLNLIDISAVPEPGSLALMAAAVGLIAFRRRGLRS